MIQNFFVAVKTIFNQTDIGIDVPFEFVINTTIGNQFIRVIMEDYSLVRVFVNNIEVLFQG
tara:strand:- start:2625 stop:2807 length:183 start_codon:yes stop_codon:yes gene_type:complete